MNQTPPRLIYMVVGALSAYALLGMGSLCLAMFWKNYADPAILTAIISSTGTALGAVGGILSSPRSAVTQTTTTTDASGKQTVSTQPVMLAPVATAANPAPVVVKNEPGDPVPTEEQPKP